ncbi:MAG: response regulator [Chloroflexi bacterium]|nr:response regulator [Chloroflexota bacterium]
MVKRLVIDDNSDLRAAIRSVLESAGYETVGAENGVIGRDYVLHDAPDLIFSDTLMPQLDGIILYQELHLNPLTTNIPFILMLGGGYEGPENLLPLFCIVKPFRPQELIDIVRKALGD